MNMLVIDQSSTEKKIIKKILKGDHESFEVIIESYKKLVYHIVFRMIYNDADREDICQDVFIKVYQNLSTFQFRSKFSTWISRIAYNTCLNHLAKRSPQLMDDIIKSETNWDDMLKSDISPLKIVEKRDQKYRLEKEIAKLPIRYRTLLSLYHLDGLTYQEIGDVMDLPEGTIKSYLFRARKYLKSLLQENYQLEEIS